MTWNDSYCLLWKQITIDAEGMVYLCQLVYEDRFKLVPFLSVPLKQIQDRIRNHSFCNSCMKVGGHAYQYCYDDFVLSDSPVKDANKKRRVDGRYT
jgi:hypothetical protein